MCHECLSAAASSATMASETKDNATLQLAGYFAPSTTSTTVWLTAIQQQRDLNCLVCRMRECDFAIIIRKHLSVQFVH
jgi:hypothetical protein